MYYSNYFKRGNLTCMLIFGFFMLSCTDNLRSIIEETSPVTVVSKSEKEIKAYIDNLDWEKHVNLRMRSDKCYTCITEDVLGGAEGCGIGAWLGGPLGCSIAGALVASYRSIREANATGFSKDKGPWATSRRKKDIPIPEVETNSTLVGQAHNLILEKFVFENIEKYNSREFYSTAKSVLENIPQFNVKLLDDVRFKFAMIYTLEKIDQGYAIRMDKEKTSFIRRISEIDNDENLYQKIVEIKKSSFEPTNNILDTQNRNQMEAIGYYTYYLWNK